MNRRRCSDPALIAWFSAELRLQLQYRVAAVAGVLTHVFFGLIRMQAIGAFCAAGMAGMAPSAVTAYVWLGQVLLFLVPFRGDGQLAGRIRDGSILCDLLRPRDLYWLLFTRALAQRLGPLVLRGPPILVLAFACGWLPLPPTPGHLALAAAAVLLAACLGAAVALCLSLSSFWTVAADGVGALLPALLWFASGLVLPVPLMPDWMRTLCEALPFSGLLDRPARVWLGMDSLATVAGHLANQAAWLVTLVLAGRGLLALGCRRLAVAGG